MNEKEIYQHIGETNTSLKNINKTLGKMDGKMETFTKFQATTVERLKSGAEHFKEVDDTLKIHNGKINKLPRGAVVYAMIVIGFIIIGVLISIVAW
jgi:hypothetical protein